MSTTVATAVTIALWAVLCSWPNPELGDERAGVAELLRVLGGMLATGAIWGAWWAWEVTR